MKLKFGAFVKDWVLTEVALVLIGLALAVKVASHTAWQTTLVLWPIALVPAGAGLVVLERAARAHQSRLGGVPGAGDSARDVRQVALGAALLVVAQFIVVSAMDWRVGLAFAGIAAGWMLLWTPPVRRRIVLTSTIQVRCSPRAAFDFVSNPKNWPQYLSDVEVVRSDEPIQLGSMVRLRGKRDGEVILEGDERVIAFEPETRFATEIVGSPKRAPERGSSDRTAAAPK